MIIYISILAGIITLFEIFWLSYHIPTPRIIFGVAFVFSCIPGLNWFMAAYLGAIIASEKGICRNVEDWLSSPIFKVKE